MSLPSESPCNLSQYMQGTIVPNTKKSSFLHFNSPVHTHSGKKKKNDKFPFPKKKKMSRLSAGNMSRLDRGREGGKPETRQREFSGVGLRTQIQRVTPGGRAVRATTNAPALTFFAFRRNKSKCVPFSFRPVRLTNHELSIISLSTMGGLASRSLLARRKLKRHPFVS